MKWTSSSSAANLSPGSHEVMVAGLLQRYHVAGDGPLCIVHPGGPGIDWRYMRMPKLEGPLTLVYLEPIGTGDSGRLSDPAGYTIDRYATMVSGLIDHLGVPAYLLGHSHGGFVAQTMALTEPEKLLGLVLYDTAPTAGAEFWAEVRVNVGRFASRNSRNAELKSVLEALDGFTAVSTDAEATANLRQRFPIYFSDYWGRESEFAALRDTVTAWHDPTRGQSDVPFDVREKLHSITLPALIIVGAHDVICSSRWASTMFAKIPGARMVTLEKSGHFGHLEEAGRFAESVSSFCRGN